MALLIPDDIGLLLLDEKIFVLILNAAGKYLGPVTSPSADGTLFLVPACEILAH